MSGSLSVGGFYPYNAWNACYNGLAKAGYDFRLLGLVAQGSIPWVWCVGLMVLCLALIIRVFNLKLTVQDKKEDKTMKQRTHFKLLGLSMTESLWTIGTNYVAGTLPT